MIELIALDFAEDINVVILILAFFGLYKSLSNVFIKNSVLAMIVSAIIIMLVAVPYVWFRYVIFCVTFLYAAFSTAEPKGWWGLE